MSDPYLKLSLARQDRPSRSFDPEWRRVQVTRTIDGILVSDMTIDTASDVPCIAQTFIDTHPSLKL